MSDVELRQQSDNETCENRQVVSYEQETAFHSAIFTVDESDKQSEHNADLTVRHSTESSDGEVQEHSSTESTEGAVMELEVPKMEITEDQAEETLSNGTTEPEIPNVQEVQRPHVRYAAGVLEKEEAKDEETEEQKREFLEKVSKQSRPFLLLKIVQFIFACLILPLAALTWPVMLVRGNIHVAVQPLVACVTYQLYCPIVFFGYLGRLHTPACVMLMLDMLGTIYFTVSSATFGVYWADLVNLLSQIHNENPPLTELEQISMSLEAIGITDPDLYLAADRLLMCCLLCCSCATTYLFDVFLTLKYLVYRKIPLVYRHKPLM